MDLNLNQNSVDSLKCDSVNAGYHARILHNPEFATIAIYTPIFGGKACETEKVNVKGSR
jgi:hypothetical protein